MRWGITMGGAAGVAALLAAAFVGALGALEPAADPAAQTASAARIGGSDGPPNVLFIVWDTVRADRMSLYGNPVATTPHLERLAASSAVYDNAISPSYWTLPSHASMFTGLPVSSHGANAEYKWLDSRFITLAEYFRDHGWDTYAWSSNPNINKSANTIQGFDTFHQPFAQNRWRRSVERATKALIHPKDKSSRPSPERYKSIAHHKGGPVTHEAFTGWLEDDWDGEKPFFAFLNYMEAHAYRLPSQASRKTVMPDEERFRKGLTTSALLKRMSNVMYGNWKDYKPKEKRALLDVYDASIRDLDLLTHRLLADLKSRELLDNTIVVITSDHGEQFGEHGLWLHNYSVYQPLVHVPLLIRYPQAVEPVRHETAVSTTSLFSTLVDLAGIEPPDPDVQAIDRTNLLDPPDDGVVTELTWPCAHPDRRERLDRTVRDWEATYTSMVQGGFKYIEASNGEHELYQLAADPRERENLFDRKRARAREFSEALEAWREGVPRYDATEEERAASMEERKASMSDDLMRELQELGYVED
jgi:arylsulfatase A-like enzyme